MNKREAPDYYDGKFGQRQVGETTRSGRLGLLTRMAPLPVIKKPMDLGLVTKKLKACQYKSKKEFADDLHLIYENCLVYNTNPVGQSVAVWLA